MSIEKTKVTATRITGWDLAKKMALRTEGKEMKTPPTEEWIRKMCLCEHSPLRLVQYEIYIQNVPQWLTVHLVRHKIGIEHFVHSQRPDRNSNVPENRDELSQGALNDMTIIANAQALINISKVRLCNKASKETREVWNMVREAIKETDPILASFMVPSCIYRGQCPEMKSCNFSSSEKFQKDLNSYQQSIK